MLSSLSSLSHSAATTSEEEKLSPDLFLNSLHAILTSGKSVSEQYREFHGCLTAQADQFDEKWATSFRELPMEKRTVVIADAKATLKLVHEKLKPIVRNAKDAVTAKTIAHISSKLNTISNRLELEVMQLEMLMDDHSISPLPLRRTNSKPLTVNTASSSSESSGSISPTYAMIISGLPSPPKKNESKDIHKEDPDIIPIKVSPTPPANSTPTMPITSLPDDDDFALQQAIRNSLTI